MCCHRSAALATPVPPSQPSHSVAVAVDAADVPEVVEFLERLWRKFGQYSADKLGEITRAHPSFESALKKGKGEEVPFEEIVTGTSENNLKQTETLFYQPPNYLPL